MPPHIVLLDVMMPDTDVAFAYKVSERLRHSIETTHFRISRSPGSLNLTIGIAVRKARATRRKHFSTAQIRRSTAPSVLAGIKWSQTLPSAASRVASQFSILSWHCLTGTSSFFTPTGWPA